MTKPTAYPIWSTDGAAVIAEPTLTKKQQGWLAPEKPSDGAFNWWMNLVYQWIVWLASALPTAGSSTTTLDSSSRVSTITNPDGTSTVTFGAYGMGSVTDGTTTNSVLRDAYGNLTGFQEV